MSLQLDCLMCKPFAKALFAVFVALNMSGCVTTVPTVVDVGETRTETETNRKESRYELEHDTGPARPVNVDHIAEPVPRVEPRTAAGNKSPYTIKGRTYRVMGSPEGYKERGVASWYGKKFHGKATSNGELYDMYAMTAAHKTLPIPSYVRVTNVANKKSVIVRVNDRGPFHNNRIIDLSYSAAKKVGVQAKGTGEVMVEYIDPRSYSGSANTGSDTADSGTGERAPTPQNSAGYAIPKNTFLQVGAFGEKGSAMALRSKLLPHTQYPVLVLQPQRGARPLYRVRIGPLKNNLDLMYLKQRLKQNAFPDPHVVQH